MGGRNLRTRRPRDSARFKACFPGQPIKSTAFKLVYQNESKTILVTCPIVLRHAAVAEGTSITSSQKTRPVKVLQRPIPPPRFQMDREQEPPWPKHRVPILDSLWNIPCAE